MDLAANCRREMSHRPPRRTTTWWGAWFRPAAWGVAAAVALLGLYLGIITVAQDWSHARDQLAADRWFAGGIVAGFGFQVALFVHLLSLRARAHAAAMATSTGTSTAAMVACCAHHLADALPLVGLSGAAVFLNDYRGPILWTGIAMNALSIAYLLKKVLEQRVAFAHPGQAA